MSLRGSIVCFSSFDSKWDGDGGQKRTSQIELLLSAHYNYTLVKCAGFVNNLQIPKGRGMLRGAAAIPFALKASKAVRHNIGLTSLCREGFRYDHDKRIVSAVESKVYAADFVVWECNTPGYLYLPYLLKHRYNKRVIACSHNIESLVPYQKFKWSGIKPLQRFEQELESLRKCDKVFVISEEEQWLLSLMGINAKYLPYYPSGKLLEFLLAIRLRRSASRPAQSGTVLIIGSATNAPTKFGMERLLKTIQQFAARTNGKMKFAVVGFGTEYLRKEYQSSVINVIGEASVEALRELMVECKAVLINQGTSTGSLTKICEFLIAGVPIVLDEGSARSYQRMSGLYIYANTNQMEEYINTSFAMPEMPAVPLANFDDFYAELKNSL